MAIDIGRAAYEKHQELFYSDWDHDDLIPWEKLTKSDADKWRELAVAVLDATTIDDNF